MPEETMNAIEWALTQTFEDDMGQEQPITSATRHRLVDHVRTYFNEHGVEYDTFSFADLEPYLPSE